MKIGIDISQIVYKGTGVSRFTTGLVNAILDYDNKNKWLFFFSGFRQNPDPELENKILAKGHQLTKWKLPPSILSFLWNDFHEMTAFNSRLPDLDWFITSDWTEPPFTGTKKATIVHDLVYKRFPETVDKKIRQTQRTRLHWVENESKIIFADSESTKNDLNELLKIDKKRIVVNYPGVDVIKPAATDIKQTRKKYGLTKPFILTVGKLEPRKNLERLVKAFQQINNQEIELAVCGSSGWGSSNLKVQGSNIKMLGFISDADLYSLHASALYLAYPSLYEGFGYPIIEAMKLGTPVTCSNSSSMVEIAGNAALLFDPENIDDMTRCLSLLTKDEKLRKELIIKGLKRSKIFTWKNYYNKLISTLK